MFRILLISWLLALAVIAVGAEVKITAGDELARKPAIERGEMVRKLWQPTALTIPEGHSTLAAIVQILAATGNDCSLANGVDGARALDFPGFSGDWWGGVLVVCEYFGLEPAPGQMTGNDGGRGRNDYGQTIPALAGPLVLATRGAGANTPRQVCGPLLIEVPELTVTNHEGSDERWADFALRVRIEPRFDMRSIGRINVRWSKANGAAPTALARDGILNGAQLHLDGLPVEARRITLSGDLSVSILAPLHIEAPLQPGDTALIDLGDQSMVLKLFNAEQARAADKRGPCAVLTYPNTALSGIADISVNVEGQALPVHGSGMSRSGAGESEQTTFFAALADVSHQVVLDALQPVSEVSLPLLIDLDLGILPETPVHPDGDAGTDVATTIVLPGGDLTLDEAVKLLRAGGNTVLVDLGVDGRAHAKLPAARLSFWDATLAVTRAFDLDLMPPQAITTNPGARDQQTARIMGGMGRAGVFR